MNFSRVILYWYNIYKRELPWRGESDPYKIWISEIILQQTRVVQGKDYYKRFIKLFPTVKDLAEANEDEVMKAWQGLGYYSRARNLQFSAKHIQNELKGVFPKNYSHLLKLKGVGPYVAAAVASIAYAEEVAAIDGNVYRVFSRIFGIEEAIDSSTGKKYFQNLGNELIKGYDAADFNQAVMEFGALQCTPKQPKCAECPFNNKCVALKEQRVDFYPVKTKKTKQVNRFFHYLHLCTQDKMIIKKRTNKDIWSGLYDFYLVETQEAITAEKFMISDFMPEIVKGGKVLEITEMKPHILSHQKIHSIFYRIEFEKQLPDIPKSKIIKKKDIANFAYPRLIDIYLSKIEE